MRGCAILVHRNYAEGLTAIAYFNEEDARREMTEAVDSVISTLNEEGYSPKITENGWDNIEVSAASGNIYYEWSIILSEIR